MDYVDIIGYIAGVLIVSCQIPQVVYLIKTKRSRDVSITMFIIMFVAEILWIIYGVLSNDLRIIVTNVLSIIITTVMIVLCILYRHN
jgi:MtN3 and saliva related transmembrane protein